MQVEPGFLRGAFFGWFGGLGGQAIHWFMTSSAHPDASTLREVGVGLQLLVGLCGAAWLYFRSQSMARLSPPETDSPTS